MPSQTQDENNKCNLEFGYQVFKIARRVTYCKNISRLIRRRYEIECNMALDDMVAKKMIVNLNVLSMFVKNIIINNLDSTTIIIKDKD